MTRQKYIELKHKYKNSYFELCYEVYIDEAKGNKIGKDDFDQFFSMWVNISGGIQKVLNYLDNKYK